MKDFKVIGSCNEGGAQNMVEIDAMRKSQPIDCTDSCLDLPAADLDPGLAERPREMDDIFNKFSVRQWRMMRHASALANLALVSFRIRVVSEPAIRAISS